MSDLFLNYLIEFAILLPAAVMTLMPLRRFLRYRESIVYIASFACISAFGVIGALVASSLEIPTDYILIPECLLMLVPLMFFSTLGPAKTAYCFLNAAMLCSFSTMYSFYITAPWELGNANPVLTMKSGLVCLLVTCVVCALFARTLLVKLPELFATESLNNLWKRLAIAPFVTVVFIIWITPMNAVNVMVGLLRPKGLVTLLLIPVAAWFLHHIAWLTASRTSESARLTHENNLLKLEEKRHNELLSFIDDARVMRHDFRHHMAVVSELSYEGKADEAAAYADQFVESSHETHTRLYSKNYAVDAIAAHYDAIAKSKGVVAQWTIDLPQNLPVKEVDFCSALGNLVENAIIAAAKCADGARNVTVKAGLFSGNVITLVVENDFAETPHLGDDGLPASDREDHGIGLASVAAIAHKYGGSLDVSTEGSIFTATVLLYANER